MKKTAFLLFGALCGLVAGPAALGANRRWCTARLASTWRVAT